MFSILSLAFVYLPLQHPKIVHVYAGKMYTIENRRKVHSLVVEEPELHRQHILSINNGLPAWSNYKLRISSDLVFLSYQEHSNGNGLDPRIHHKIDTFQVPRQKNDYELIPGGPDGKPLPDLHPFRTIHLKCEILNQYKSNDIKPEYQVSVVNSEECLLWHQKGDDLHIDLFPLQFNPTEGTWKLPKVSDCLNLNVSSKVSEVIATKTHLYIVSQEYEILRYDRLTKQLNLVVSIPRKNVKTCPTVYLSQSPTLPIRILYMDHQGQIHEHQAQPDHPPEIIYRDIQESWKSTHAKHYYSTSIRESQSRK